MSKEENKFMPPPCGCIPKSELNKWRFKQISNFISDCIQNVTEIPTEYIEEYNYLGEDIYHWNDGKKTASLLPNGEIIVSECGIVGIRGELKPYYEYDEKRCFPCIRCKGKKSGEFGLDN